MRFPTTLTSFVDDRLKLKPLILFAGFGKEDEEDDEDDDEDDDNDDDDADNDVDNEDSIDGYCRAVADEVEICPDPQLIPLSHEEEGEGEGEEEEEEAKKPLAKACALIALPTPLSDTSADALLSPVKDVTRRDLFMLLMASTFSCNWALPQCT